MNTMTKEQVTRELIAKQLKGYKEALELIPSIKEVAKQFDGKKINKRFDTALKKVNDSLSFTMEYNSFRVKYYNRDGFVNTPNHTEYIKEDIIDIVFGSIKSSYNDGICQDDTFNYDNFEKAIDGSQTGLTKYINETNEQLSNLEELQKEKAHIEELKSTYNDKVNFIMGEYYNLRIK